MNPYNKRVDKLAKAAADLTLVTRRQERMVARKISPRHTEARIIPMRGQAETIRIVAVRAVRGQPHHAYKYEVVREDSPNFHDVDGAFAKNDKVAMRRAHIYEVRLADEEDHRGRWIEEVVREISRDCALGPYVTAQDPTEAYFDRDAGTRRGVSHHLTQYQRWSCSEAVEARTRLTAAHDFPIPTEAKQSGWVKFA